MAQVHVLDQTILERILLLQSSLPLASGESDLAERAVRGLKEIPGVSGCAVCLENQWAASTIDPSRLPTLFPSPKDESAQVLLPLRTSRQRYGGVLFCVGEETEFQLYRPFLENTAGLIALLLENRRNTDRLAALTLPPEPPVDLRAPEGQNPCLGLQRSRERFRLLFESAGNPIAVLDGQGAVLMVNRAGAEVMSLPSQEIIGKSVEDFFPEKAERIRQTFREVLETGVISEYEEEVILTDGRHCFLCRYQRLADDEGAGPLILAFFTDVTRLKRTEEVLQYTERIYREAIEAAGAVAYYQNYLTDSYEFISPGIENILGYPQQDFTPVFFDSLETEYVIRNEFKDLPAEEAARLTKEQGKTWKADYRYRTKTGEEKWLSNTAIQVRGEHGDVVGSMGILIDITERKQAEERLRAMADMLDTAPNSILVHDFEGRFLYANRKTFEIHGCDMREFMALSLHEIDVPESEALIAQRMRIVAEKGEASFEVVHYRKDRSTVPLEIFIKRVEWAGRPAMLSIGTDITERKRAQAALRDSRADLNRAQAVARTGSWRMDVRRNVLLWSDENHRIFGLPANTPLTYETFLATVHPDDRDLVNRKWTAALRGEPYDIEHRICVGGAVKWVRERAELEFDSEGMLRGGFGTTQDITDWKRAEEAVRASETRFRLLAETIPLGIEEVDLEGRIVYANSAYARMIGASPGPGAASFLGTYVVDPQSFQTGGADLLRDKPQPAPWFGKNRNPDGKTMDLRVDWDYRRDADGTVTGCIAVISDITEQTNLETHLRHSQKMEAIGRLAGGVAHDFNNILSVIYGYSDIAKMGLDPHDPVREAIENILTAAHRAKDVVQQILNFTRSADEAFVPTDLRALVKESLKMFRASIPTSIAIRDRIETVHAVIHANPTQVQQVLMNLVMNARQAIQDHGAIEIALSTASAASVTDANLRGLFGGRLAVLSVTDTGCGMTPEILEQIFDPYFTTKPHGEGTGLGLSIVHGIVKNHSGAITVTSQKDAGSTFTVYWPLVELSQTKNEAAGPPPKAGKERILLVDDEIFIVQLAKTMLERLGYTVTTTVDSAEALRLFADEPDRFDLVITDMTMPKMAGDLLAQEILRRCPDKPIILMSGYHERINAETAHRIGVRAFLEKPYTLKTLSEVIRRAMEPLP